MLKPNNLVKLSIVFFLVSMWFLGFGFYKIYVYDSYEPLNAYVGGDAYNYIINGNYATGYFVLCIGFLISGLLCNIGANIISCYENKSNGELSNNYYGIDELPPL